MQPLMCTESRNGAGSKVFIGHDGNIPLSKGTLKKEKAGVGRRRCLSTYLSIRKQTAAGWRGGRSTTAPAEPPPDGLGLTNEGMSFKGCFCPLLPGYQYKRKRMKCMSVCVSPCRCSSRGLCCESGTQTTAGICVCRLLVLED